MKVVILAGGYGTRISEESHLRPKPMIEIGGRPILWHIMKIYSHYGFSDFVICLMWVLPGVWLLFSPGAPLEDAPWRCCAAACSLRLVGGPRVVCGGSELGSALALGERQAGGAELRRLG